jgi:hypothetical protein
MDYTAQGHTVGLAQRMEALAEAGRIYLTDATARLIEGFFALEDLGEFRVKGASGPVRAYALEGVGPLRSWGAPGGIARRPSYSQHECGDRRQHTDGSHSHTASSSFFTVER